MHDFQVTWLDRLRGAGLAEVGVSALLHGALLLLFATAMATLDADDREVIAREQVHTMRAYLGASGSAGEGAEGLTDGAPGLGDPRTADGRDGASLDPAPPRKLTKGSSPLRDVDTTRPSHDLTEYFGQSMIGLLQADLRRSAVPSVAWGPALDRAEAAMTIDVGWGSTLDGVVGHGLGLSGGGEGGGGRGAGIAIGAIGSLGRAGGVGDGQGSGIGHCGVSRDGSVRTDHCLGLARGHVTGAPTLRCGGPYVDAQGVARDGCTAQVNGRLMPEIVQRVVHANFGRFRACYAAALAKNPALEGRVTTKFVIDREGAVSVASDAGSDLPDDAVRACVVRAFASLSFPRPEGGIVTVVYPLVFSSAE